MRTGFRIRKGTLMSRADGMDDVLTRTRECWEKRHADCYGERFVPTWLICDCKCHRFQRAVERQQDRE